MRSFLAILWHFWSSFKAYEKNWQTSAWPIVACPHGHGPLAKNGTYRRDYIDAHGSHTLTVQRYRCRACRQAWTLLPTFVTPFAAHAQGLVWAVSIWHGERGWSWRRIVAWLADHGIVVHIRTIQRWAGRWRRQMAANLQRLVLWIGDLGFPRHIDVWGRVGSGSAFQSWQRLWRGVQQHVPVGQRGALWVGPTLLGLLGHTECRMVRGPTSEVG